MVHASGSEFTAVQVVDRWEAGCPYEAVSNRTGPDVPIHLILLAAATLVLLVKRYGLLAGADGW